MPRKLQETTEQQEQQIVHMYSVDKQPLPTISEALGLTKGTVRSVLSRHGVALRPKGGGGGHRHGHTASSAQEAVSLYLSGASCEDVAAAFNTDAGSVLRWVRAAGGEVRPKGFQFGEAHHAWAGGRITTAQGYTAVRILPDDPLSSMAQSKVGDLRYALEHRVVMARHLGRLLADHETVHHLDGNKQNNDISNLQLRQGRHGKGASFVCADCGSHNVVAQPLG